MKTHGYARGEGWHGEVEEFDTVQCCHCGSHFPVVPGSGRKRGWCMCCNRATCGRPQCDPCVHFLKKIELAESGIPYEQILARLERLPVKTSLAGLDIPKSHLRGAITIGE